MDESHSWVGFLLFAAALFLFYVMYGFGAAVQALNTSALEDERDEGNQRAEKLLAIQENPYVFIRTNQLVTSLLTLAMGAFSLAWAVRRFRLLLSEIPDFPPVLGLIGAYLLALVCLSLLIACLGVMVPKRAAGKSPIRFCYKTLPIVLVLMKVMRPFTWLVEGISFVLLRLMGIDVRAKEDKVTEEDIMYMVNEGHDQGVLEASEAEMITNIFEFDDKVAADIMTHRKNMVALEGSTTLREAVDFIVKESNNSRFPVYEEEDLDNIVGILHMRDVLCFAERGGLMDQPIAKIPGLLHSAHFVPERKNINALFKEMQSKKIHMEIVVDEYGQTTGLVTMEDILEEIVGNIMDEYDHEEPDIVPRGNGVFQLAGKSSLEDIEDALGIEFDEEDKDNFDTLNGLLISRLGHLPDANERVKVPVAGYIFWIVQVENKMIHTVIAKPEKEAEKKEKE